MSHRCRDCRKKSDEIDSYWDRIRLWFFNLFTDDIADLIQDKYTQGYGDAYKAGFDRAKELVVPQIVCSCPKQEFPVVNAEDVLTTKTVGKAQMILLNGEKLTDSEFNQLKSEAKFFQQSRLWKVMQETLKDQAEQVMFKNSQTYEDMKTGKLMLRNLDVQKKIVEMLVPKA